MTTEADFIAALDANPSDHMIRLAFADWLDEQDPPDPRAAGYRALGHLRLKAHHWTQMIGMNKYGWYKPSWPSKPYHAQVLPEDWYSLLTKVKNYPELAVDWRYRREAEDDAAVAFSKLPKRRQTQLLRGRRKPTPTEAHS